MSFEIQISGQTFTQWETANVSRSLDDASGKFSFTNSSLAPADFPVRCGDPVRILVNGNPIITGYVDSASASGSNESHTITVSGRDTTSDLIDSSIPDSVKNITGPIFLRELCERVISALGANIQVTDTTVLLGFIEDAQLDATDGDSCMEFLMNYARKEQVYLIPDGRGRLQIFRPGGTRASSPLIHLRDSRNNNVKQWRNKINYASRFRNYICRSQDNVGFDESADYGEEGTARTGQITDNTIRTGRLIEIKAEESMTDAQCLERAKEEANLRRVRSTEYTAVLAGSIDAQGSLWSIGDLVEVQDDFADLRGDYLVRSVEYSIGISQGTETLITIAPIDAYTVQGQVTPANRRKSKPTRTISTTEAQRVARRSR